MSAATMHYDSGADDATVAGAPPAPKRAALRRQQASLHSAQTAQKRHLPL